jgi:hypothetical protein
MKRKSGWGLFSSFDDVIPEGASVEDIERLYELRRKVQESRGRGFVILVVVAAVVIAPLVGLVVQVPASDFSAFMAPITGIAGTIIGYWFGSHEA